MDNQVTLTSALDELDYSSNLNLILREDSSRVISEELEVIWNDAKEKLEVDAVYFLGNAPVIYFKRFEALDTKAIANFHCNVWNQSQVPLIIVILPTDIRVYSGYEAPTPNVIEGLGEPTRLEIAFNPNVPITASYLWVRLKKFTRDALESGSLWRDYSEYFRKETRVDQVLLANLRYVRQELIKLKNLPPEHAHSLIGRSIFALYLQDRGVLSTEEPNFFAERYNNRYRRYTDLLISYEDTYDFFEFLHNRFNGDMFPVTEEEKKFVDEQHLATLRELFTVDRQAGGQMLFFWAYNFKFIPIELISSIYEEFLHQEKDDKNGAYYTPPMLVDFVLNVTLPWTDTNYKLRLLDPACGSGIFLVEAYRRLVERWRKVHNQRPLFKDLSEILTASIFGVDIKRQALRVAAFSLYLAMLDYLEPKSIWMDVHFPPLIGTNLIVDDFFDKLNAFHEKQFDLVVGNPPWESKLTEHAIDYLRQNNLDVGDKQIAQAFLWHAPDFCTREGQIALLCSSKS
ncbi:MAG: class I SAM-dependent DNA methyltransferase, partial [Ktedonobacteraceae bacterium]